jgi:uncharacterized OsmC-like protein
MSDEGDIIEIKLQWKERMKILSHIRDFEPILVDDRKKGDDSAPSPVEIFLTSVGSCLAMSFIYCNHLAGVQLNPDDLIIEISGELGRVNDRLRLIKVHANFILHSDQNSVKIHKCFEKFQPFCILSESIQAGIPFSCDMDLR